MYGYILAPGASTTTRIPGTPNPYNNETTTTTAPVDTCEDEVALIPDQQSYPNSASVPRFLAKPRTPYKPTDVNPGEVGISFPQTDKAYIIIFPIAPASTVKYIRLPKSSNVDQIRVMFLDDQDKPLSAQPSDTSPFQITSKLESGPKLNVNFPKKVNAVHITLVRTSDNQPPRGVTVEIIVCIEPKPTPEETTVTTPTPRPKTTPPSNYSATTPCKKMNFVLLDYHLCFAYL